MIKLLNLDPVSVGTTPAEEAYMRRYLRPDTVLVSRAAQGVPEAIESEYDEAAAAPRVVEACVQAEREGFDGIFVDCFGDPGVRAAREAVDIPVFGGFEPAMHLAMGVADRIAVITVLPGVVPMIRGAIARAGLERRVVCVESVDIPVLELGDRGKLLNALSERAVRAHELWGAEAVALGCTAMIGVAEKLEADLENRGLAMPVIEAGQAALTLLELYVGMGLKHSRSTYHRPVRLS
ncbi:MAG: aspartate/glutamate racemase family protein [Enterocloster asparagiformis]|nr:aspartate/glutamate racemase family protein [Enterocloster asparagiformis]